MLALPLIALFVVAPSERKCSNPPVAMPGYELRQPVALIDGVILPPDAKDVSLDEEDIESIWIRCWNHATSSFELIGIPLILVHTKSMLEATRAPLLQLVRAQEEFRSRHQRYATDLASRAIRTSEGCRLGARSLRIAMESIHAFRSGHLSVLRGSDICRDREPRWAPEARVRAGRHACAPFTPYALRRRRMS